MQQGGLQQCGNYFYAGLVKELGACLSQQLVPEMGERVGSVQHHLPSHTTWHSGGMLGEECSAILGESLLCSPCVGSLL